MERVDEAYAIRRYQQAAALLPLRWQRLCRQVPEEQQEEAEELRLRAGQTLTLLLRGGEVPAARERPYPVVTQTELEQLCDGVTDYSRYAAADTLSRGYLTARGGFRIGVCGTAVLRDGVNTNLRDISSVTIRIAREQPGLSAQESRRRVHPWSWRLRRLTPRFLNWSNKRLIPKLLPFRLTSEILTLRPLSRCASPAACMDSTRSVPLLKSKTPR